MNKLIGDRIPTPADRYSIRFGQNEGTILALSVKTERQRMGQPGDMMLVMF
jgi:hypothetical protein